MRPVLFGATDLTRKVAVAMEDIAMPPCAIVTFPQSYSINFTCKNLRNTRFFDLTEWAQKRNIPLHVYERDTHALREFLLQQSGDFALFAGWYYMAGSKIRSLFKLGCAGLHGSLLPKLRGFAPLNWALLTGQDETGVTLFELGNGMDDGPIYGQKRFTISAEDYIDDLITRSQDCSVELVKSILPQIASGSVALRPQKGEPTYALHRQPSDSAINWLRSAEEIECLVRASSHPYPGAYSYLERKKVYIWKARALGSLEAPTIYGRPGQIMILPSLDAAIVICGDGLLALLEVTDEQGASLTEESLTWNIRRFSTSSV